jgi:crotonobetainyl-CoA:carnitine CoA-transferase CaiB-like acyl-CoA transferase
MPLSPFVVVDLSRILAGPFATQLLADLGARVIKVEPPGGDPTRGWGPPFEGDDPAGESAYFRCANRGKEGLRLDLHHEEGRLRLFELLAAADVLVENFLPESVRRLGLTWDALHARFPRLVVASIRSFASDTPAAERPGYDFLLQAEAGWMSVTGPADGAPAKVGMALVDVLAALYVANGIQAALLQRERTGRASHVEVPLMEAALAGLINVGAGVLMTQRPAARHGNAHPNIVPYQTFPCSDGEVAIAVGDDRRFHELMEVLGLGCVLRENPAWRTNAGRVERREAVVAAIAGATRQRTREEVLAACEQAGVAAGPVRTVDDALLGQRGTLHHAVVELCDPATGRARAVVASPVRIDGRRACSERLPPRSGGQ